MIFTQVIEGGRRSRFSIMFFGNPPLASREFMHANGFRWRSGFWYRRSIADAAEFIQQLNRVLHPERADGRASSAKIRVGSDGRTAPPTGFSAPNAQGLPTRGRSGRRDSAKSLTGSG